MTGATGPGNDDGPLRGRQTPVVWVNRCGVCHDCITGCCTDPHYDQKMPKTLIAYVDGFNLYNGIHDAFGHRYLWLDLIKVLQLLRPNHQILRVNYFTAPLLDDPGAQSRQATYWNALEATHGDRVPIVKGRYQRSMAKCKGCGTEWPRYEEKETDVNLALTIARDAATQEATDYYLISGDSDAAPAIREAQRINPSGFYKAYFPPERYSDELKTLMPLSEIIGRSRLRDAQLPEVVHGPEGQEHRQPLKWKPESFIDDGQPVAPHAPVTVTPADVFGRNSGYRRQVR